TCPMVALQWGHGKFAVENMSRRRTFSPRSGRFNGATANSPWRTSAGRRSKAPGSVDASMGPRQIRRGEPGLSLRALVSSWQLQWGHGKFAVENAHIRLSRPMANNMLLQWGHGKFAVENHVRGPV